MLPQSFVPLALSSSSGESRLLRQQPADHGGPPACAGTDHETAAALSRRRYGPEVVQLLETLWEVPGVNYVGGSRQLRRRVGAPTPLRWQGGGPRWVRGLVGG